MRRRVICRALVFASLGAVPSRAPGQQTAAIAAIRDYALNYTRNLPNYACKLTTHQILRPAPPRGGFPASNTVVEQLSFSDGREVRTITLINGHNVSEAPPKSLPGMSTGEFGNLLDIVFDPATGADIRWDRAATLDGHRVDVLSYHVAQPHGYGLVEPRFTTRVPFEGFVYADIGTHAVQRIQMKCTMIPKTSSYSALELTLNYKAARIAGQEFILPSHLDLHFRTAIVEQANSVDYTDYRRFTADSAIQFEGAPH